MSLNFIKEEITNAKVIGLSMHKKALQCEIEILKNKLESNDFLVIQAAIGVLQERCDEIDTQIHDLD
jgi:hypothetical protein